MKSELFEGPSTGLPESEAERTYLTPEKARRQAFYFLGMIVGSAAVVITLLWNLDCNPATLLNDGNVGLDRSACSSKPSELGLVFLALSSGVVGGLIHAATSFTTFAGNRQLVRSWLPWLYLRGPIAGLLAFVVYLGVRAGIFGTGVVACCQDIYRLAFLCAIAGLFSKQVTDKLADLVDVLFATSRSTGRRDPLLERKNGGADRDDPEARGYDETVQRAQRLLIEVGALAETNEAGASLADGVLGARTRAAIDAFLDAQGITGTVRADTVGDESNPEFWSHLIDLLEKARELQRR